MTYEVYFGQGRDCDFDKFLKLLVNVEDLYNSLETSFEFILEEINEVAKKNIPAEKQIKFKLKETKKGLCLEGKIEGVYDLFKEEKTERGQTVRQKTEELTGKYGKPELKEKIPGYFGNDVLEKDYGENQLKIMEFFLENMPLLRKTKS